jgi:hypothetical protein
MNSEEKKLSSEDKKISSEDKKLKLSFILLFSRDKFSLINTFPEKASLDLFFLKIFFGKCKTLSIIFAKQKL